MRWLRDAGWLVALGLAAYIVTDWLPKRKPPPPDPQETRDRIEKQRAEFEAKQTQRAEAIAKAQTDGTLDMLRVVGRAYLRHTARTKTPPREEDFEEVREFWRSRRDEKPFVIVWGVDPIKLPDGGSGTLLAWEQVPDDRGRRAVLMADGKTAKVVTSEEFESLPRAK
jgi:hypothetical protein